MIMRQRRGGIDRTFIHCVCKCCGRRATREVTWYGGEMCTPGKVALCDYCQHAVENMPQEVSGVTFTSRIFEHNDDSPVSV